jgi:hypothetical protein
MIPELNAKTAESATYPMDASTAVNLPDLFRRSFRLCHNSPTMMSTALVRANRVKSSVLPASPCCLEFNSFKPPAAATAPAENDATAFLNHSTRSPAGCLAWSMLDKSKLSKNGCKTERRATVKPQNAGKRCISRVCLKIRVTYVKSTPLFFSSKGKQCLPRKYLHLGGLASLLYPFSAESARR